MDPHATMSAIRVTTFKNSHDSFVAALEDVGISYSERMLFSESPMASGFPGVVQALSDAMPWNALAKVIVAWIEARASRKVIITLEDHTVFHAEGYSVEQIERALDKAINLVAIDTKPTENESAHNI